MILKTCTSLRFTAPAKSFAVEFVVTKDFGCESLNIAKRILQHLSSKKVVVYMLSCVFWQHIPLEIEFPSRGFYSYAQWYDP